MICGHCKKEIDDDSIFCPECGHAVNGPHPDEKETKPEQSVTPQPKGEMHRGPESPFSGQDGTPVRTGKPASGQEEMPPRKVGTSVKQEESYPREEKVTPNQEKLRPVSEHERPEGRKPPWVLIGGIGAVVIIILFVIVFMKGGVLKKEISYDNAIDAVHNNNVTFRGIVISGQQGYQLSVLEPEAPFSICAVDVNGKETRADDVYNIALSLTADISAYLGKEVYLEGEVCIDGNSAVMYVDTVQAAGDDGQKAEETAALPQNEEAEGTEQAYTEDTEVQTESETESSCSEEEIHEYILCVEDCTWTEAFQRCKDKGGYLVRINSKEEFTHIRDLIKERGYEKIQFYIGMRREPNQEAYYLVDENNELVGERMDNGYMEWCKNIWLSGEPTYRDTTLNIEETCVSLFRYSPTGKWVFNDVPEDLIGALSTNAGKVGYICEKE